MINKIKLDTLEVNSTNGYYLSSISGLGYATKYPVAKVAQLHGAKIGNAFYENRVLSIEIKIIGDSVNDYIAKRKALFEMFALHEFGDDFHTLEITLSNGIVLTAEGVAQGLSDDISAEEIMSGSVAFTFEMEQPFFKSLQQYQVDIFTTQGGGIAIPAGIPLDMTEGSSGYTQLSQSGNVFCYPELYFYGPLTNPVLTNVTTGKVLSLAVTLASPNYYYVDTYNRIVTDNVLTNKRDKATGDFLVLASGVNQFSLITDNMSEVGYVRIIYKDFYISI